MVNVTVSEAEGQAERAPIRLLAWGASRHQFDSRAERAVLCIRSVGTVRFASHAGDGCRPARDPVLAGGLLISGYL